MARPQVADGGTACRRGVSLRVYSMSSRGRLTRGGSPTRWFGEGLTTPLRKKLKCYEMEWSYQPVIVIKKRGSQSDHNKRLPLYNTFPFFSLLGRSSEKDMWVLPHPLSSCPQLGFPNIRFPSGYLTKWLIKMVGCHLNIIINYANKICFCHLFLFSPSAVAGNWPTSLAEVNQMAPFHFNYTSS